MDVMAYFVPQARLPFKKIDETEEEIPRLGQLPENQPQLRSRPAHRLALIHVFKANNRPQASPRAKI
jgi:hypothetical protein